jgi:hypothetical protein
MVGRLMMRRKKSTHTHTHTQRDYHKTSPSMRACAFALLSSQCVVKAKHKMVSSSKCIHHHHHTQHTSSSSCHTHKKERLSYLPRPNGVRHNLAYKGIDSHAKVKKRQA